MGQCCFLACSSWLAQLPSYSIRTTGLPYQSLNKQSAPQASLTGGIFSTEAPASKVALAGVKLT